MSRSGPVALFSMILLGWSAGAGALGFDEARHLLVRTGFEATPAAIERLKPLTAERAVALILKETRTEAVTPAPEWITETSLQPAAHSDAAQRAREERRRHDRILELKGWWFRELRATPSPLTERMTLLWEAQFPCELDKVPAPPLSWRRNALLRRESLGNFRHLLQELSRDPATLSCLGIAGSRKGRADGTFARLLLERTVGRGHFTDSDVREAARAFTGWRVNARTGAAEFDTEEHDGGNKRVLGRAGRLEGDDVIEAVLRDPRTAESVVRRLWREFIDDQPESDTVQRLAQEFRKQYEIRPLLRELLLSKAFRNPARRGQMIKSPVELLAGTARQFGIPVGDGRDFAQASRALGQDPFDPPRGGWSGRNAWITADMLDARWQMLGRLLRGLEQDARGAAPFPPELDELTPARLTAVLLAVPPVDPVPAALSSTELSAHLMRDPAYQLK